MTDPKPLTESELDTHLLKKRTITGVISFVIRSFFLQGIGLTSAIVVSLYLGPEDFAVFGVVTQLIGLLVFVSDIGLAAALIQQHLPPTLRQYRVVFTAQLLLSLIIFGVLFGVGQVPIVSNKIGEAGQWLLFALALSFPLASLKTIPSIMLERELRFSTLVWPQIIEQLVFHSTLIVMSIAGFGVWSYFPAVIGRSISGVIAIYLLKRWPIGLSFDLKSLRQLIRFGALFQLNDVLARVKDQFLYILLGWWLPLREFGYLQWAKNWSMYPYTLSVQSVMAVTFPTFSRLQHAPDRLRKAVELSTFLIASTTIPMLIGLASFAPRVIELIPRLEKWQPALFSLAMFSLSIVWGAISTPLTNTLNAMGKISITLKLMVVWTILTWTLTWLLVKTLGFQGVSIAAVFVAASSPLTVAALRSQLTVQVYRQVIPGLLSSTLVLFVAFLGRNYWGTSWSWLLSGLLLAGSSYAILVAWLGRTQWHSLYQTFRRR